ncbi:MAG: YIP1 family protein [Pseudomonadota bacterium]
MGQASLPEFDWRRPQTFLSLAMAASTSPRAFFAAMPTGGSLVPPMLFLVLAQFIPAVVQGLAQISQHGANALAGVVILLLKRLIYFLIFADLIWVAARFASRSQISFINTIRLFCYSSGIWIISAAVWVLSPAPAALVFVVVILYHLYLVQVGLQVVANLPTFPAMLAVLLALVAFVMLWIFVAPMLGLMPVTMPPGAMIGGAPPAPQP